MDMEPLTEETALARAERFISTLEDYPVGYSGRGVVICGGGMKYFGCAWVCINMLRHLGFKLPIQLWHLGPLEMDWRMRKLVAPLGVECIDGLKVRDKHPVRTLRGWEIKPFALLYSPFAEVLLVDADNVAARNPEYLFESHEYKETGAIFWPDFGRLSPERSIWKLCGVDHHDEPEFESGQIVVDKQRCWKSLRLAMWYNEHSDFFYRHVHGDKETFHMAWRKLNQPYSMAPFPIRRLRGTMCQHDFEGNRIFQHRNMAKWTMSGPNQTVDGFEHEDQCLKFLGELTRLWDGQLSIAPVRLGPKLRRIARELTASKYYYRRVGYDSRMMTFLPDGRVGDGSARCEIHWQLRSIRRQPHLDIYSSNDLTCRLKLEADGSWRGRWVKNECMPVELMPATSGSTPQSSLKQQFAKLLVFNKDSWKPWWTPFDYVPGPSRIKMLQVCPTAGGACGVGNFAMNLATALGAFGIDVETTDAFKETEAHAVLVQHEYGLFTTAKLRHELKNCTKKKLLLVHTPGVYEFDDLVDGYASMCPGMVASNKPVCIFPHPAFVSSVLEDKKKLREEFGLNERGVVLGSSGFLSAARRFDMFTASLVPLAAQNNWFVWLLTSRHLSHERKEDAKRLEAELTEWQKRYPTNFSFTTKFTNHAELNRRMQSCDLLWCWTATPSAPYGSGSCADLYGGGRTLVVANKAQHSSVFDLPNVVVAENDPAGFIQSIIRLAQERNFETHQPTSLSWAKIGGIFAKFVHDLLSQ